MWKLKWLRFELEWNFRISGQIKSPSFLSADHNCPHYRFFIASFHNRKAPSHPVGQRSTFLLISTFISLAETWHIIQTLFLLWCIFCLRMKLNCRQACLSPFNMLSNKLFIEHFERKDTRMKWEKYKNFVLGENYKVWWKSPRKNIK